MKNQVLHIDRELETLLYTPVSTTDSLQQSILKEGIRNPIVVYDGKKKNTIVDGHRRYKIALEHKLAIPTINMQFDSLAEVKIWIIKNQTATRNLSKSLLALMGADLVKLYTGFGKKRQAEGGKASGKNKGTPHDSSKLAANDVGVSKSMIDGAIKVLASGDQGLIERIRTEDITLSQAMDILEKAQSENAEKKFDAIRKEESSLESFFNAGKKKEEEESRRKLKNLNDEVLNLFKTKKVCNKSYAAYIDKKQEKIDKKQQKADKVATALTEEKQNRSPLEVMVYDTLPAFIKVIPTETEPVLLAELTSLIHNTEKHVKKQDEAFESHVKEDIKRHQKMIVPEAKTTDEIMNDLGTTLPAKKKGKQATVSA